MEKKKEVKINAHGSLAILALGHVGLRKWRQIIEVEKAKDEKDHGKKTQ